MPLAAQPEPATDAADLAAALPTATHDHLLLTLLDPKVSLLDLIENVEGFTITHFLAWFQSSQVQATIAALTSFYHTRAALLSLAGIDRAVESLAALTEQPIPEAASPELQARWRESTRKAAAALLRQAKSLAPTPARTPRPIAQPPATPASAPPQESHAPLSPIHASEAPPDHGAADTIASNPSPDAPATICANVRRGTDDLSFQQVSAYVSSAQISAGPTAADAPPRAPPTPAAPPPPARAPAAHAHGSRHR